MLLALLPASGCKKDSPPAPVAVVPAGIREGAFHGVKFHYPLAWTAREDDATKGLDVTAPVAQDEDYPPGMLFQVDDAPAGKSLEQMLADANLTMSRSDEYVLKAKKVNAPTRPGSRTASSNTPNAARARPACRSPDATWSSPSGRTSG